MRTELRFRSAAPFLFLTLGALGAVLVALPLLATYEKLELLSVSASIRANGKVEYQVTVHLSWRDSNEMVRYTSDLSGTGVYDPAAHRAEESLVTASGAGKITSRADCLADPWLTAIACTNDSAKASWNTDIVGSFGKPISASGMSAGDREKVKAAFARALEQKKADDEAASRKAAADAKAAEEAKRLLTNQGLVGVPITKRDPGKQSYVLPTATPIPPKVKGRYDRGSTSIPIAPYAAEYVGGIVTVKANQLIAVPFSIKNVSTQTWPANGPFQLGYHWMQGTNAVVFEGDRTLLPSAVAPGVAVALSARLKGPPTPGAYTLKWDMVQGTTWFSSKGVPTKDQSVTVTP